MQNIHHLSDAKVGRQAYSKNLQNTKTRNEILEFRFSQWLFAISHAVRVSHELELIQFFCGKFSALAIVIWPSFYASLYEIKVGGGQRFP